MVAADARTAVTFSLSPGQAHDAPEGRKLLRRLGHQRAGPALVMDRAYEGDATRQLALDLGFTPVVPPLKTRRKPWVYDREIYKRRGKSPLAYQEVARPPFCGAEPEIKGMLRSGTGGIGYRRSPGHLRVVSRRARARRGLHYAVKCSSEPSARIMQYPSLCSML